MKQRTLVLSIVTVLVLLLVAAGAASAKRAGPPDDPTLKVIVLLKPNARATSVVAKLKAGDSTGVVRYHIIPAVSATVSRSTLQALRKDAGVLRVVMDHKVAAPKDPTGVEGLTAEASEARSAAGDGPLESEAVQLTHADDAWNVKVNGEAVMGQGVRVGMLDTGTDPTHPDLAPAIEAYRDFTGSGLYDNDGHGTATSSCVAAQGLPVFNQYTATTMRYSGMAPKAKVLMAKVIDVNGGWDSNIIRGTQWLVDQGVDIISCSLGVLAIPADGNDPSAMAAQAAIDAGITFINSEGNEGPGQGTLGSAPDRKDVLAVGATTGFREFAQEEFLTEGDAYKGDQVITWSSRGPNSAGDFKPDIMGFGAYGWALAPMGGTVYGDYAMQEFGGTSMAAPVVAGDLALAESAWKLAHPGRALPGPAYWKKLLASTATDLGYAALDQSSGLANAKAAVMAVLGRGKSMMVSVKADGDNPASWSPRLAAKAKGSTTITVKNTGNKKETVKLSSRALVANDSQTIVRSITLNGPAYAVDEPVVVPKGTDFVQVTCTWPSGPAVSIRTSVYDSDGNFITYAPTYGGYGHLSCDQVSLMGPKDQRPVVRAGAPWTVSIYPRASMMPTGPQQVNLRVEFMDQEPWSKVKLAKAKVTLRKGRSARIKATVTAPRAAGTHFGGITVSNGETTTMIPVAVRVPVAIRNGQGTFSGKILGSTAEYFGGEFYFYDFTVPSGTTSLAADITWLDQGNLVNLYLVDPSGRTRVAKGGDLWAGDYSAGTVPESAFTHTAEQVVWDSPAAGKWQLVVWAPGFSGNGFFEPYSGTITLNRGVVSPAAWTATVAAGGTVTADFSVANAGPSDLAAYAESQMTYNGTPRFNNHFYAPWQGTLTPNDIYSVPMFYVPQKASLLEVDAVWKSDADVLIDLGLYDPVGNPTAVSLATTTLGNSILVTDPMSGLWYGTLAYGDPATPAPPLDFTAWISFVAPLSIQELTASADFFAPVTVAKGGSGTINARIDVPPDAEPGSTIEGTLDFYTSGGVSQMESAGGDHLGSVPVSITVTAAPK
jgi:hypothetical protein